MTETKKIDVQDNILKQEISNEIKTSSNEIKQEINKLKENLAKSQSSNLSAKDLPQIIQKEIQKTLQTTQPQDQTQSQVYQQESKQLQSSSVSKSNQIDSTNILTFFEKSRAFISQTISEQIRHKDTSFDQTLTTTKNKNSKRQFKLNENDNVESIEKQILKNEPLFYCYDFSKKQHETTLWNQEFKKLEEIICKEKDDMQK